jgi:hypothetical protein
VFEGLLAGVAKWEKIADFLENLQQSARTHRSRPEGAFGVTCCYKVPYANKATQTVFGAPIAPSRCAGFMNSWGWTREESRAVPEWAVAGIPERSG